MNNPEETLRQLMEGNHRYRNGFPHHPDQTAYHRRESAGGQHPDAILLGCADSRVPPEIIFDCGLGRLFVVRTAGQVLDSASMGGIEFGVLEFGIPLVLVLGHSRCGAISAVREALHATEPLEGSIGALVEAIRPAVELARGQAGDLQENAVRANIELAVERLKGSPVLAEKLRQGKLTIQGAYYDLVTGAVELLPAT